MALVPVLDLRPVPGDEPLLANTPHNLEAEQALLGALLFDNAAFERLSDHLQARHFYEPLHARLFAAIEEHVRKGQLAEPVDRAPPAANAADYGRVVYELALRRDLIRIGGDISTEATRGDAEMTAREQIEAAEQQLYELAETGGTSNGLIALSDALRGAVDMAAEAFNRDGGLAGLSTGLKDLDQKLGGLHKSDLLIIAGRPSMGKSSLALNIGYHVAKTYAWEPQPGGGRKTVEGGVVAFFSLEMSAEQLAMRLVAEVSGVPSDRLRKGEIEASEFGRVRDAALDIQG